MQLMFYHFHSVTIKFRQVHMFAIKIFIKNSNLGGFCCCILYKNINLSYFTDSKHLDTVSCQRITQYPDVLLPITGTYKLWFLPSFLLTSFENFEKKKVIFLLSDIQRASETSPLTIDVPVSKVRQITMLSSCN